MGGSVTAGTAVFREASAETPVESLPLGHLSIELGHLYFDELTAGPSALEKHFAAIAPAVTDAIRAYSTQLAGRRPRISTCFLIDDYFGPTSSPAVIVPEVVKAAHQAGIPIDYLARESACAVADGVALAKLVEDSIVVDPVPGTNGSRPPFTVTGWLCNGKRSPEPGASHAMAPRQDWRPPEQNAAYRHSIFIDVQLWSQEADGTRTWSCAYLAAVWQLLRLGLLRTSGAAVATPRLWSDTYPGTWAELPPVMCLNPQAAPFSAYQTLSFLSGQFFLTEAAVRVILSQIVAEPTVVAELSQRAAKEGVPMPRELVDRLAYRFG